MHERGKCLRDEAGAGSPKPPDGTKGHWYDQNGFKWITSKKGHCDAVTQDERDKTEGRKTLGKRWYPSWSYTRAEFCQKGR